ncbi:MAG: DUF2142 domain-containing protein [Clostridia bacterium]|nr:DUF2142 domain-containing protein [Clostridia bacterium]
MKKFAYRLPQTSEKKNFIFNMLGSLTNATVSLLLMIVVSHIVGSDAAGVFSLAYSTAQMMYTICVFEMRNIQVTDAKREMSFESISMFRVITIAAMWAFFGAFATFKGFDKETVKVMLVISVYMMLAAISDLFQGNLHRNGYLSIAGRSLACQTAITAIVFSITLVITKQLFIATLTMPIVVLVWILLHDIPLSNNFGSFKPSFKLSEQKGILLCALPLFASSFMHQFIFNSPKYAIENALTKTDQAHYGYLVMPVFAINLLSIFAFRPQLIKLSKSWAENRIDEFKKIVSKLYGWVVVLTIAAMVAGYFLGIPVLEMLYKAELSDKKTIFITLLFAGGLSAASTLTLTLFTTMRKQKLCLIAYVVTMLFALVAPDAMVSRWGLTGAALSYLCEMAVLFAVMFSLFLLQLKKPQVDLLDEVIKKERYTIVATVLSFALSLLVCVSIFLPKNVGNVLKPVGYPVENLSISQIESFRSCRVEASGKYTITDVDPQIIFSCEGREIECVEVAIQQPVGEVAIEVYTAYKDGQFSAERCYSSSIFKDETSVIIDIPKGSYDFLRIDIDTNDIYFKNVGLYETQPESVPFEVEKTAGDYFKAIAIPVIIALIVRAIDKRTWATQAVVRTIARNKIKIAEFIVFSAVAILGGMLVEMIISRILPGDFNKYRFVFFAGIAELVVVFIRGRKYLREKTENVFLPIALTLGVVMLLCSPIKHIAWDLDSHYPWAVQASYMDTAYITGADYNVDKHLGQSTSLVDFSLEKYNEDLEYLNSADETLVAQQQSYISIAHIPAGIFIAVARFFGASFAVKYNVGRLAYLLVYSFVCYFAIKKLKTGKMILAVICLFPTNLFLATNYSYDWCVTAFTMLGTAYFVSELQQPEKPITITDTIIMALSFTVGAWPKLVYIILMGMTLFMRKNWPRKSDRRTYYAVLVTIFSVLVAYFVITTLTKIGGPGDIRGGDVNPSAQLAGIRSAPFGYAKLLFKFLLDYLSIGSMQEYISHFGYLGLGKYWFIAAIVLGFTALTDTNKRYGFKTPLYIRGLAVLLFVGMASVIATALYINFTPLNATTINGCQPRYLTPLLAPLLLLVTGKRFNIFKNKAAYSCVIFAIMSAVVMLEIYSKIVTIML